MVAVGPGLDEVRIHRIREGVHAGRTSCSCTDTVNIRHIPERIIL